MCTSSTSTSQCTRTLMALPPHVATKLPVHLVTSQLTIENMTGFINGAYDAISETSQLQPLTTTTTTTTTTATTIASNNDTSKTENHRRLSAFISHTAGNPCRRTVEIMYCNIVLPLTSSYR